MTADSLGFTQSVRPGGYAWWYVDGLSDDGQYGLTIIAFIGSVFSPYYAWAGRRDPENHVSLNVALYGRRGRRWAMTERSRDALGRDAESLSIGPSNLVWDGETLTIRIDERAAPVPLSVRGVVRVHTRALTGQTYHLDPAGRHRWRPIAPIADLELSFDRPAIAWRGSGYLDTNAGDEPIENAFLRWDWSRAPLRDGTAILYDLTPSAGPAGCLALKVDRQGNATGFPVPPVQQLPTTLWQVKRTTRADPNQPVKVRRTLEDAPFYARTELRTCILGEETAAVHESFSGTRFASTWVKGLLPFRMPRGGIW